MATKQEILDLISSRLANNNTGQITPEKVREVNEALLTFSDDKASLLQSEIDAFANGEGKTYKTLAAAMAVDPLPADNTPFRVDDDPSPAGSGRYIYDSGEVDGYDRLGDIIKKAPDGLDPEDDTDVVTGKDVWPYSQRYPFADNIQVPEDARKAIIDIKLLGTSTEDTLYIFRLKRNASNVWQIAIADQTGTKWNWNPTGYTEPALQNGRRVETIDISGSKEGYMIIDWEALPDGYDMAGGGLTTTLLDDKVKITQELLRDKLLTNLDANSKTISNLPAGQNFGEHVRYEQHLLDNPNRPVIKGYKNLFNKNSEFNQQGQLVDGVVSAGSSYTVSNFIECDGAEFAKVGSNENIAFYTAPNEASYIASSQVNNSTHEEVPVPATATHLRFTLLTSNEDNVYLKLDDNSTSYSSFRAIPYSSAPQIENFINLLKDPSVNNSFNNSYGDAERWGKVTVQGSPNYTRIASNEYTKTGAIQVECLTTDRAIVTTPIISHPDLSAGDTVSTGVFIHSSTGNLDALDSYLVFYYGDGNVRENASYFTQRSLGGGWYWINLENHSFPSLTNPRLAFEIHTPTSDVTITIASPAIIKSEIIKPAVYIGNIESGYSGVKWASYGDSITAMNLWQPYVNAKINFEHYLRGIGSSRVQNNNWDATITEPQKAWVDTDGLYLSRPSKFGGSPDNTSITSDVSAGATTIPVTDESIFTVGDTVYIYEASGTVNWEEAVVDTVSTGQITVTTILSNSYATANGAAVDLVPSGGTLIDANMVTQDRIDTIPADTELITVFGGANDNGSLGTLADAPAENSTFYAAYKLMLNRIYTRLGDDVRIIICTMPYHKTADAVDDLSLAYQNRRNAIIEIGKAYGLPVVNFRELCGWNSNNVDTYLSDNVHPNDTGGKRMAEVLVPFMRNLESIK